MPAAAGYDIAVHGPNGFLRRFAGDVAGTQVEVSLTVQGGRTGPTLRLTVVNPAATAATVRITGPRPGAARERVYQVGAGATVTQDYDVVAQSAGWYDVTATVDGDAVFRRRFAGHLEYGAASNTG